VAEAHAGLDVQVAFIRAAVVLRLVHPVQALALGEALAAGIEQTGDAAHGLGPGSTNQWETAPARHGQRRILTELGDAARRWRQTP
jgi:hypothetical protein